MKTGVFVRLITSEKWDRAESVRGRAFPVTCALTINRESFMTDQHQVNSIIATAICDSRKDHPDQAANGEEAKQIAKCIIEALTDAGLQVVPVSKT